jgi:hypothetical protein
MESVKEQRICVKFCIIIGKTAVETHSMLHEANSDVALSQTMTCKVLRHFKNGRTSVDNNEQCGQPSILRSEPLITRVRTDYLRSLQIGLQYPLALVTQF